MMGFVPLPTYWIRHNIYIHSKNNREEKVVLFAILLFLFATKSLPNVGTAFRRQPAQAYAVLSVALFNCRHFYL